MSVKLLKSDLKCIAQDPILLASALYPLVAFLFLRFVFYPVSEILFLKTGFHLEIYYTVIAITLISAIPLLLGFIYAVIDIDKVDLHKVNIIPLTPEDKKYFIYFRLIVPALLSFIVVFVIILFTDPVPSEGWLRSVFVSILLTVQVPLVLLYIRSFSISRAKAIILLKIYGILLAIVPLGLLLHHPWNYFLFYFPYYWISWAWVIYSTGESFFYGVISTVITVGYIIWFYSHLLKKNKT
jgi:fluoroquinolone transport system permease protein